MMPTSPALLPQPKRFERQSGSATLDSRSHVLLATKDDRLQRAVKSWQEHLPSARDSMKANSAMVRIAVEKSDDERTDAYRLAVTADAVAILAPTPAGCFHALHTLDQLRAGGDDVSCCLIEDWADFQTRGLLHDVSRGKVPTLDTLKLIADRLASLKANQLQLYIEHAFTFDFDPDICAPDDGLTPDEIRELDGYCKDRFIDLVPAVATLGHMGKILSIPKYRYLAEIEPTQTWDELDWPQRARGFTLDIANPQSFKLVENIWSEILDAFSGTIVNICGDEPWDLGKGKNREGFASGIGRPYIDHILRTSELCASRGRSVQVWSDVICKHPEQFGRLPSDLTVLHWGYDDNADYDGTGAFVRAGLNTFVCPGISGWKRILPAMSLAERNIARFAAAGRQHGATGLINTDWGDHGHFHTLGSSWHGIALGAACAWTADHPTGAVFDDLFARSFLGLEDAAVMPQLRRAAAIAGHCETWRLLWQPVAEMPQDPTLPATDVLGGAWDAACDAGSLLRPSFHNANRREYAEHDLGRGLARDFAELIVGVEFTELFAERVRFARNQTLPGFTVLVDQGKTEVWRDEWIERLNLESLKLSDCWIPRNKPSGLADIRAALLRCVWDLSYHCGTRIAQEGAD